MFFKMLVALSIFANFMQNILNIITENQFVNFLHNVSIPADKIEKLHN